MTHPEIPATAAQSTITRVAQAVMALIQDGGAMERRIEAHKGR